MEALQVSISQSYLDGFVSLRWEYTKYGARKIEAAINEELSRSVR
ncbi:hypothetical protein QUW35_03055 [Ligilactobacillus agilis]|nr:hypothetical protein [Ligilactobacillus agilis]MDM8279672.1 hypothetical protein [Ligilactobacillus agilis]